MPTDQSLGGVPDRIRGVCETALIYEVVLWFRCDVSGRIYEDGSFSSMRNERSVRDSMGSRREVCVLVYLEQYDNGGNCKPRVSGANRADPCPVASKFIHVYVRVIWVSQGIRSRQRLICLRLIHLVNNSSVNITQLCRVHEIVN
jgi:hypothetical protein